VLRLRVLVWRRAYQQRAAGGTARASALPRVLFAVRSSQMRACAAACKA
jgi:hypothetical protein